jgi:hypothetical protein
LLGNKLGEEGATLLGNGGGLPRLRALDVTQTALHDAGALALIASPLASRLDKLRLRSNKTTSHTANVLATCGIAAKVSI